MMIAQAALLRICAFALALGIGLSEGRAQINAETGYATKFFLDQPPSVTASSIPKNARDVIVAKVRIVNIIYQIGPDQSGLAPPLPKDLFFASVEFIEVLQGKATSGARAELHFGIPGTGRRYKYPHTPAQLKRDYFVVSYLGEDNTRRLIGFPITEQEYEEWWREVSDYDKTRQPRGARDHGGLLLS